MGANEDWEKYMNKLKSKRLTRGQAIKYYCRLECCAGDLPSYKECTITNCFLWRFRFGKEIVQSKPNSFKKQRKSRVISAKETIVQPDTGSQQVLQTGGKDANN